MTMGVSTNVAEAGLYCTCSQESWLSADCQPTTIVRRLRSTTSMTRAYGCRTRDVMSGQPSPDLAAPVVSIPDVERWADAIFAMPASSPLPARVVLVPSEAHAHVLRTELAARAPRAL